MEKQGLSIFNIGANAEEFRKQVHGERGGGNEMFDIRVDEGKQTSFIVRVVPYINDIASSKVTKFFYSVPNGTGYVYFDSATSFNNPKLREYHFCPISDLWAKLRNNDDPNVKKKADELRRQVRIVTYVLVVNCPDKPELNGKIMPMQLPIDLDKAIQGLAEPNEADRAMGAVPIEAYDLFAGVEFKCTIQGHKPFANQPVMRNWTIVASESKEIKLPLGPNGALTPISQLSEDAVSAYFMEQQTIDLKAVYGYNPPSFEAEIAAYHWASQVCHAIPGMQREVDNNFKRVFDHLNAQNIGAMAGGQNAPVQTEQVVYNAPGNPMAHTEAGNPMAQPVQPAPSVAETPGNPMAQPVQPAPSVAEAGNPMAGTPTEIQIP